MHPSEQSVPPRAQAGDAPQAHHAHLCPPQLGMSGLREVGRACEVYEQGPTVQTAQGSEGSPIAAQPVPRAPLEHVQDSVGGASGSDAPSVGPPRGPGVPACSSEPPLTPAEGQHPEPREPPCPSASSPPRLPGEGAMRQGCQGAWPRVKVAFGFSIKASARRRALWERPAPRQGYPVWHPPRSLLLS